jgi:hypothetical protein
MADPAAHVRALPLAFFEFYNLMLSCAKCVWLAAIFGSQTAAIEVLRPALELENYNAG